MTKKSLAFEIGTEEMPAFDLKMVTDNYSNLVAKQFENFGIEHGDIKVYSSPRRLIFIAEDVPSETESVTEEHKGPSKEIAYDEAGQPTKAAIGFARGKGLEVEDLELREVDGKEYIYAVSHKPAQNIIELCPELCLSVIKAINWPKAQRWGDCREEFVRPVRWLLALFGEEIVELSYANLTSSNKTRGHRLLANKEFELSSADKLIGVLESAYVIPSFDGRKATILDQVEKIEKNTGFSAIKNEKTLTEVVNLCEYPTCMLAEFDPEFLGVPQEVLIDAMLVHQRYLPLADKGGKLTNKFIVISNGNKKFEANIVDGNQRVVAARLYDAKFFYDTDLKTPLSKQVDKLGELVFQEDLGSLLDKTKRIVEISAKIAAELGISGKDLVPISRAALLCKADLTTGTVIEFTSLQGVMGKYFAKASGEDDEVALAIEEHYMPKAAGGELPSTLPGQVVSFADKIDSICGLFAVGQLPTGSSDPFALRRSALGIIAMQEDKVPVKIENMIDYSLDLLQSQGIEFDRVDVKQQILDFFIVRTKTALTSAGYAHDAVEAVLASNVVEPNVLAARVKVLTDARKNSPETFDDLATAHARANNLRDPKLGPDVDSKALSGEEAKLYQAVSELDKKLDSALEQNDYELAIKELAGIRGTVDEFFDKVLIVDKQDKAGTENRLRLLNYLVEVFMRVADFSKMSKK